MLLRDVVYRQIQDAIEDGTLEPGERHVDDDLTSWLGVSRTPVREAIPWLVADGLVEMAANRYTRVSVLSAEEYQHASELLSGLQMIAVQQARFDAARSKSIRKRARGLVAALESSSLDAYRQLQDVFGDLIAALGNPLMASVEAAARSRAKHHAAADDAVIDWPTAVSRAKELASD